MKIHLASDIHAEFDRDYELPTKKVDVIVLAGDLERGAGSARVARWFRRESGVPVVFIGGNHEFYRGDINSVTAAIRNEASGDAGVHFLENESVVIKGVRFLGCTLWANFELAGAERAPEFMSFARRGINDFRSIRVGDRCFEPEDAAERFRISYQWLDNELAKPFKGKTVVVTHFSPHRAAVHPRYLPIGADRLTPYFNSDCSMLMEKHRISAWFYGHTHHSIDCVVDGGTRLVSNQMGYPSETFAETLFDQQKIITI